MRFVSIREFRSNSATLLKSLPAEGQIVITVSGKPKAVISPTDDGSLVQTLETLRREKALRALAGLHTRAQKRHLDKIPADEIQTLVKSVRRGRRR
ncbi:MAG TPA: type II toxin-antitoxin system prevent-host-death family antitoxin [Phycisphaerae bacterium]|nr:type II toxin-antitoxin system prevent-host-death family antitoxin [Phycisphaerae bacterium]